jgi:tRNA(Ile)-lysidine synthase
MSLTSQFAECLKRHGLEGTAGIIAVSGGPDSVALAHLGIDLLDAGLITRLTFAHVNHQLRGEESDADEAFVQNLPALWKPQDNRLVFRSRRIDAAAIAQHEHENLEAVARRERYRWFTELAAAEGASWIATGHTADDQAETVLFRLLRGSGVLGLGGMVECRTLASSVPLLRPLLSVRRSVVLDCLHDKQIAFCVDSSNRDLRFARNRLRHELLPMLEHDYNPGIVDILCRLAEQAQELHREVSVEAARLLADAELPRAGAMLVFSIAKLRAASPNCVREMIRLVWQREAWPMGDMDFERWHRLVEIAQGSLSAWDFPGKIHARKVGSVIQIRQALGDEPAQSS